MSMRALILPGLLVLVACERSTTAPADTLAPGEAPLLAQTAGEGGLVRTTWPSAEDPGPPFYARTAPPPRPIHIVDGWSVIQFYRDPACIRPDFNLLAFFDPPAAFGCPLVVEGFALWDGEPFVGAPKMAHQRGMGAVPFWFIPADAVLGAIEDGVLTIGELAALPGLIVGYATYFNDTQHPTAPPEFGGGGHRNPVLTQNARGTLEDGRGFQYHLTAVKGEVKTIRLRFR